MNSHPRVHNAKLDAAGAPQDSSEYIPPRIVRRVEAELERADPVLVPSTFVAGQLLREGIPSDRLAMIRYGVDPVRIRATPTSVSVSGTLGCLFVGQISWRKGIRVLLNAARELIGAADFTLVGPVVSPEVLRDRPSNVALKKTLSHQELRREYQRADVFVLPSIEDAYPLVTLEALASGLPVIVSDGAGSSEAMTDDRNGIVVRAGDAGALAEAIRTMRNAERRAALGVAGRELVEGAYSWNEYSARVLRAITSRTSIP